MKMLYLMQGVPGSGKSTVADLIARGANDEYKASFVFRAVIFSTDNLWYEDGVYKWDRNLLGAKHTQNQSLTEDAMRDGILTIIIDNTNITKKDAKPYMDLAFAYGYQVQVVRVSCSVETAVERQKDRPADRQVPREVIERMATKIEDLL